MDDALRRNIFDKLEREWRLVDPERPYPEKLPQLPETERRLKVSRVD